MKPFQFFIPIMLAMMLALPAGCMLFPTQEGTSEYMSDTTITAKVKAAIVNEPELKATEIHVETLNGKVQLSGFVNSPAAIQKAGAVAREVKGVTRVQNDIRLKNYN